MQGKLMLQYCCAGMLACVSNVVTEVEGFGVFWASLLQALGATGAITPQNIHTFPAQTAKVPRLTHALYGLYDTLHHISGLQDLPYGIETSGDDCSAWRQ